MDNREFWMVYVSGRSGPTQRHATYESAKDEAKRLCRKAGVEAFVLRAEAVVRPVEPPIEVVRMEARE